MQTRKHQYRAESAEADYVYITDEKDMRRLSSNTDNHLTQNQKLFKPQLQLNETQTPNLGSTNSLLNNILDRHTNKPPINIFIHFQFMFSIFVCSFYVFDSCFT